MTLLELVVQAGNINLDVAVRINGELHHVEIEEILLDLEVPQHLGTVVLRPVNVGGHE